MLENNGQECLPSSMEKRVAGMTKYRGVREAPVLRIGRNRLLRLHSAQNGHTVQVNVDLSRLHSVPALDEL